MSAVNTDWTPDKIAPLKRLFDEGCSFSHIAGELALTRSAIGAKLNRLGLRRGKPPQPLSAAKQTRSSGAKAGNLMRKLKHGPPSAGRVTNRVHKLLAGPPLISDSLPEITEFDLNTPKRQRKKFFALGSRDCKYPIGDPQSKDFFFCGAQKLPTLPYCAEHARRCYHPARGGRFAHVP